MKYSLPCLVCNEPVNLTRKRLLELVKAGAQPVCRRNGCYQLCGVDILSPSKTPNEGESESYSPPDAELCTGVAGHMTQQPRSPKGEKRRRLASRKLSRYVER